ncbi:MAG: PKD domain-containing protein [Anaerolineae bacterium]|nr:PKD domain-containing protein [Anaerolineae bacterium]
MTSRLANWSRLALVVLLCTTLALPARAAVPAPARETATTPPPLPRSCGFSTPGGVCCVFGYVYLDDEAIQGAQVTLTTPAGASVTVTTTYAVDNPAPYYSASLSAAPLNVEPGTPLTVTAVFSELITTRVWTVQPGSQQIDLGLFDPTTPGPIIYVDASAGGANNGTSWDHAFTTLQPALDAARPGDEIWVAAGVYTPTAGITRSATFQLADGVALYGGFAGGESARDERDWAAHVTVLSGDLDGNDLTDTHGVTVDTAGIVGSNAYHVVTGNAVGETAVLDGFVVTGGLADGPLNDDRERGGGMVVLFGSPTVRNTTFQGNFALNWGGGLFNEDAPMAVTHLTFRNNAARDYGGGGMLCSRADSSITNVAFYSNTSEYGGGFYNSESNVTLTHAVFHANSATTDGGGVYAIDWTQPAHTTLTNVVFWNNHADANGGAVFNCASDATLVNVSFYANSATGEGGGIFNYLNTAQLHNTILWGNAAATGAQIHNMSASLNVAYCLIEGCGGSGAGWDASLGSDGGGNLDTHPFFVDPASGDLHLDAFSPAIDAGNNAAVPPAITTDLDNNPRFVDMLDAPDTGAGTPPIVDMGAYEYPFAHRPTRQVEAPRAADATPPTASFTLPTTGASPFSVSLVPQTSGDVTAWTWDLGDGRLSGARFDEPTFTLPGTYTVTLTVTGPGGTAAHAETLIVAPPPAADFRATPLSGIEPLTVAFTATVTAGAYLWDLGDGATSTLPNLTHVYAAGSYTASLTVFQGHDTNVQTARIIVQPSGWSGPTAHLAVQPATGDANTVFTFDPSGSSAATAARFDWNADGVYDTPFLPVTQAVTHTFAAGNATVHLQVRDALGATHSLTHLLTVRPAPEWLFILYLAGDNNLYGRLRVALDRLEAAPVTPNVTIVALLDGPANGDTWRYHIQSGGNYRTGVNRWFMGEAAMDAPQTLVDFVTWARGYAPADHTLLAIADHGRGTTGVAWDETSGDDQFLAVQTDLESALTTIAAGGSDPLDVLFLDACLMGLLETAYEVGPSADYLVASQNLGWGFFAYDEYAAATVPGTTPSQLAAAIAAIYNAHLATGLPGTISAIDLAQVDAVAAHTDLFAQALIDYIDTNSAHRAQVAELRAQVQTLDGDNAMQLNPSAPYVDLYHFGELASQAITHTAVVSAARDVMTSVSAAVVAHYAHSRPYHPNSKKWNLDNTHGLAIYFPISDVCECSEYIDSPDWRMTLQTRWDAFLQHYLFLPARAEAAATACPVPEPPPVLVPYEMLPRSVVQVFVDYRITSLALDGAEAWFGTRDGDLVHHTAAQTVAHAVPMGSAVRDVAVAPDGSVWVGTENGVGRFDGATWSNWLAGEWVDSVAVGPDGTVWCAPPAGLARYDGTIWTAFTAADGLPASRFTALAVDETGAVWGATADGTFGRFEAGAWVTIPGLPDATVDALARAGGVLYLGSGAGLVSYENGAFALLDPARVAVAELAGDEHGQLWVMAQNVQGVGFYNFVHSLWLVPLPYVGGAAHQVDAGDGSILLTGAVQNVALAVTELEPTGELPGRSAEVAMVRHAEIALTDLHGIPLTVTQGVSVTLTFNLPAWVCWETAQVSQRDTQVHTWAVLPTRALDEAQITVDTDHLSQFALFAASNRVYLPLVVRY